MKMKIIVAALLLLIPAISGASNITIDIQGVSIVIPAPIGFGQVTPQMVALYELQKQFVAPSNEEFLAFIAEGDLPVALKGEIPNLSRRFTVQTAKSLVSASVSTSDFLKLKNIIKTKNDDLIKKVEKDLPGLMAKLNNGLAKSYDLNLALSASQIVLLPVHEETDRTLAYSAFVKYNMNDESGNLVPYKVVVTTTFAHVKGKVLFLYAYAEEVGLEWSRESSIQWVNAVVASNPSDLQSSIKETLPSAVTGIDWGKVVGKTVTGAIIGLIVGLIVGLIAWIRKRGKTS
jgi:hypothetical protein